MNALVIDVYSLNTKVIVGHSAAGVDRLIQPDAPI